MTEELKNRLLSIQICFAAVLFIAVFNLHTLQYC